MAWTATLVSVTKQNGNIVPLVRFANGAETIDQTFQADDVDATKLAALVARKIASLNARDAALATLAPGAVTPTDLTPTQAEIDAAKFFADLAKLKAFDNANALGLLDAAQQTALSNFRATVKAAFKPAYVSDPRWR